MDYRREIDGLRAIAVLPVILFHAGFDAFGGGFVGVDVFFVISGYLITTIILGEIQEGRFSIVNFYERRARRILPALFLVMVCCIPAAWLWLLPADMKDFAQSLVAVSFFSSNILFWTETGYFGTAVDLKPLMHTWSLAVEEQFYLFFPPVLMLCWRFARRWVLALLVIVFVISLGLAQWGSLNKPAATFFLLPTRGWELLIGSLAAWYLMKHRGDKGALASEIGGWAGLALILFSIFTFDKDTPFPGFYALLPTVGTLLIILCASQETLVGRVVGNRVFVSIGLISYSAYLWHQPLFAFARHRSLYEPDPILFIALSILSLVLAWLSWRFVENPFRNKALFSRSWVFMFALVGSALFVGFGMWGHFTNGIYSGRPNIQVALDTQARAAPNHGLSRECEGGFNNSASCRTHDAPEVLVWGDSFSMHLLDGLIASKPGIHLVQKTVSACGPLLGVAPSREHQWSKNCLRVNQRVFDFLSQTPSIQYVVLSSPFSQYIDSGAMVLTERGAIVPGEDVALEAFLSTIRRIKALGKAPVVFSPPPMTGEDIGRCLLKAKYFGENLALCDFPVGDAVQIQAPVIAFLEAVEREAPVIWLDRTICSSGICKASMDGVHIYRDDGHLSHEGSAYLGKHMDFYGLLRAAGE